MQIRKMKKEDYGELIELWERAGLDYKQCGRDSKEHILKELKANPDLFLVAEQDGKIVGSVLATYDGRKGWLNRVAVDPEFQGKGLGKKLCLKAERVLRKRGCMIFAMQVHDSNKRSKEMAKGLGYEERKDIVYFRKKDNDDF